MGTVKYTGSVASFHCPTNAEIRSLKVHFSPKQTGSGNPSPDNIRPIVGWNNVKIYQSNGVSSVTTDYAFGSDVTAYGGYIDLISGKLTVEQKLCTITGEENLSINWDGLLLQVPDSISSNSSQIIISCSHTDHHTTGGYMFSTARGASNQNTDSWFDVCVSGSSGSQLRFRKRDLDPEYTRDVELYKTWLRAQNANGTPLQIVYKLTTPVTYDLEPIQLQTLIGTNSMQSDADYIEVEYDLHETQTLLQRKAFIMANQPHLVTQTGNPVVANITEPKIKALTVDFSPTQSGSGTPSPSNARPVVSRESISAYIGPDSFSISLNGSRYGGKVDLVKGILTLEWGSFDLGAPTYLTNTDGGGNLYRTTGTRGVLRPANWATGILEAYCSIYTAKTGDETYRGVQDFTMGVDGTGQFYIYDSSRNGLSAAQFKASVAGIPLVYKLITPQTYQLTPQTINALRGQQSIYVNSVDNITISYWTNREYDNLYTGGDITFARMYKLNMSLPVGVYRFHAAVTSTDTDNQTSCVRFMTASDENASTEDEKLTQLNRSVNGEAHSTIVHCTSSVDHLYLYAAWNYPRGAGDTATYRGIRIEKIG